VLGALRTSGLAHVELLSTRVFAMNPRIYWLLPLAARRTLPPRP
jgi:hypothetical protein